MRNDVDMRLRKRDPTSTKTNFAKSDDVVYFCRANGNDQEQRLRRRTTACRKLQRDLLLVGNAERYFPAFRS